jgi:hypothetical protein
MTSVTADRSSAVLPSKERSGETLGKEAPEAKPEVSASDIARVVLEKRGIEREIWQEIG